MPICKTTNNLDGIMVASKYCAMEPGFLRHSNRLRRILTTSRWPLLDYLRAVLRHGVSLMTGCLLVAVYEVATVAFPGKEHWWNKPPPLAVWSLVLAAIARAQYLAWRDVHTERGSLQSKVEGLHEMRPRLSASFEDRQGALVLVVTNHGAPAEVWAKITVSGDTLDPQTNAFAVWDGAAGETPSVRLATGETREIIIAEMRIGGPRDMQYYWFVPFMRAGERTATRPAPGLVPTLPRFGPHPGASAIRQEVTLKVVSDPTSVLPPIQCAITLVGSDRWERLSGVSPSSPISTSSTDPPQQVPSAAWVEHWDAFYLTAGEIVGRFHDLSYASEPSADDWQAFKDVVRQALSRAAELQEPHRSQALSLLRPFVDVEQATLGVCAGLAPDFRNWLVTIERLHSGTG
jgi:hypothetical protein